MIVLDTNVISEMLRPAPDGTALEWLNAQAVETLSLTSVTLAELLLGVGSLPAGSRRDRLTQSLDQILTMFRGRVLAFDHEAAHRYAEMVVHARSIGRPLSVADGYIAATAVSRGFAVATRNTRDFEPTGVDIIDPWATR